jgi:hypothetical protein
MTQNRMPQENQQSTSLIIVRNFVSETDQKSNEESKILRASFTNFQLKWCTLEVFPFPAKPFNRNHHSCSTSVTYAP